MDVAASKRTACAVAAALVVSWWTAGYTQDQADQTYHNPALGYSISYPASFYFANSPQVLQKFQTGQLNAENAKTLTRVVERKDFGMQFVVIPLYPGSKGQSNLTYIVTDCSDPQSRQMAQWAQEKVASELLKVELRGGAPTKVMSSPAPAPFAGRQFYSYSTLVKSGSTWVKTKCYTYFDPKRLQLTAFTISAQPDVFEKDAALLDTVVHSVVFQ